MGLYQIFKTEFNEVMTRHGFIHQGDVFIRVLNGQIVQGVTVKPTASYSVKAAIFPIYEPPYELFEKTKKPYWAEEFELDFNGYEAFPHKESLGVSLYSLCPYIAKNERSERQAIENLAKAAELMESTYIHKFDEICDLDSYLEWKNGGCEGYARVYPGISDLVLLYKAYLDGNFDYGYSYIDRYMRLLVERVFGSYSWLYDAPESEWKDNPRYCETKKAIDQLANERKLEEFDEFFERRESGDLSDVKERIDSESERTLNALRKKYSKLKL